MYTDPAPIWKRILVFLWWLFLLIFSPIVLPCTWLYYGAKECKGMGLFDFAYIMHFMRHGLSRHYLYQNEMHMRIHGKKN